MQVLLMKYAITMHVPRATMSLRVTRENVHMSRGKIPTRCWVSMSHKWTLALSISVIVTQFPWILIEGQ